MVWERVQTRHCHSVQAALTSRPGLARARRPAQVQQLPTEWLGGRWRLRRLTLAYHGPGRVLGDNRNDVVISICQPRPNIAAPGVTRLQLSWFRTETLVITCTSNLVRLYSRSGGGTVCVSDTCVTRVGCFLSG